MKINSVSSNQNFQGLVPTAKAQKFLRSAIKSSANQWEQTKIFDNYVKVCGAFKDTTQDVYLHLHETKNSKFFHLSTIKNPLLAYLDYNLVDFFPKTLKINKNDELLDTSAKLLNFIKEAEKAENKAQISISMKH